MNPAGLRKGSEAVYVRVPALAGLVMIPRLPNGSTTARTRGREGSSIF